MSQEKEREKLITEFARQIRAGVLNQENLNEAKRLADLNLDTRTLIALQTVETVGATCSGLLPVLRVAENRALLLRLKNPTSRSQLGTRERAAFEALHPAGLVYDAWGRIGLTSEGLEWVAILKC